MGQPLCPMTGSSRPWLINMFRKNPDLIIPSLRWTTWALTRLHMEISFIKIASFPSWTKNWPMIHFTCDLCRKTEYAPQNPLRPWFRWINSVCVLHFLIHSWHRIMPVTIDDTNKISVRWILCFAGCCVPLLGHLVTWIGRCRGMKSFIIGTNEWNSSQIAMA